MYQQALLTKLSEKFPRASLNELLAEALEISYDAAHRRTSLKSKMSFDEAVAVAVYYKLSLDELIGNVAGNFVAVEKTSAIVNEAGLCQYLQTSYQMLRQVVKSKEYSLWYSAKDIPLFYLLHNNLLGRFKLFVWLKLLDTKYAPITFSKFSPSLSTVQAGLQLADFYRGVRSCEIWNTTTINSTLKQIHFYYEAGDITTETALELCEELSKFLKKIAMQVHPESEFTLYYNELLLMNNNVLISDGQQQSLFVPKSMLSYFKTTDRATCKEAVDYFAKQVNHSKLLNTAGAKERHKFFAKMEQKVNSLRAMINAADLLDFE